MAENDFDVNKILSDAEVKSEQTDDPFVFLQESAFENNEKKRVVTAKSVLDEIYSWLDSVIVWVMLAILLLLFCFRINEVVGYSMQPTLYENDRLIIYELFYKPQYGDIVAIQAEHLQNQETGEDGELIIKRVIGLEGDVIDIDFETGVVFRNGEALDETYILDTIDGLHLGNADYPVTVDEGCVFVLGDNRNHSTDSRYVDDGKSSFYLGCVDERYIIGKAVFRFWPIDRFGGIY